MNLPIRILGALKYYPVGSGSVCRRSVRNFRMQRVIAGVVASVLLGAVGLAAQGQRTFKGQITGSPGQYVISSPENKTVYQLEDQKKPQAFAGRNVVVIGTLDKATGAIHVSAIVDALPPKVMRARSVSIDCDACPRSMAKVGRTALHELDDWGRFSVIPDRKKADLIFLFSANPYLGDYLSGRPDTRPVFIRFTYMDVIDPSTGRSLWSDSERLGSFLVGVATKDLITEFRAQLEAGEGKVGRLLVLEKDQNDVSVPDAVGK
jgi:hypothetical protein